MLRSAGWIRRDGVPTVAGRRAARDAAHEEALWALHRRRQPGDPAFLSQRRLLPIQDALSDDALQELEDELASAAQRGLEGHGR